MLKKRILGTVIVKNNIAVQSFKYTNYLPLGKPEFLIKNLDNWKIDEILVQAIDRSIENSGPDFNLLEKLSSLKLSTPIIYGGGIQSVSEAVQVIKCGADRVVLDSIAHNNLFIIEEISKNIGAQSLILSLPLTVKNEKIMWFNYKEKKMYEIPSEILNLIKNNFVSEVLISDFNHDGVLNGFNKKIIDFFPDKKIPLIIFGGLSNVSQVNQLAKLGNVSAFAIGNFLNYNELALNNIYRRKLNLKYFRFPSLN
jgi:cyclase